MGPTDRTRFEWINVGLAPRSGLIHTRTHVRIARQVQIFNQNSVGAFRNLQFYGPRSAHVHVWFFGQTWHILLKEHLLIGHFLNATTTRHCQNKPWGFFFFWFSLEVSLCVWIQFFFFFFLEKQSVDNVRAMTFWASYELHNTEVFIIVTKCGKCDKRLTCATPLDYLIWGSRVRRVRWMILQNQKTKTKKKGSKKRYNFAAFSPFELKYSLKIKSCFVHPFKHMLFTHFLNRAYFQIYVFSF